MRNTTRRYINGYILLIPTLILIVTFYLLPFIIALINSLHTGMPGHYELNGLWNYADVFTSSRFWNSLWVTTRFTAVSSIILFFLGFILAETLVRRKIYFKTFSSASILLPYIITPAVAILIWQYMFHTDAGILNHLLGLIGMEPIGWLRRPDSAMRSLIAVQCWFTLGYIIVLFASGLQAIPASYYEAAAMDGAGYWRCSRSISVPLVLPTVVFVLIMLLLAGYVNSFTLASLLTGGGPIGSTEVYMLYLYSIAFGNFDIPLSNALTMILFVLMFLFSIGVRSLQKRLFSNLY